MPVLPVRHRAARVPLDPRHGILQQHGQRPAQVCEVAQPGPAAARQVDGRRDAQGRDELLRVLAQRVEPRQRQPVAMRLQDAGAAQQHFLADALETS